MLPIIPIFLPLLFIVAATHSTASTPITLTTKTDLNTRIANIHITISLLPPNPLSIHYGPCDPSSTHDYHHHHTIAKSINPRTTTTDTPFRIVWIIPKHAPYTGCLSAVDEITGEVLGKSEEMLLKQKRKRSVGPEKVKMDKSSGINTSGPWFDGIKYLEGKDVGVVDVRAAKEKRIGIVGAGMAGLLSSLILHSQGFRNFEILESSNRIGGRIRTVYLNGGPDDYQYQEMGPMRFPEKVRYAGTNETVTIKDHQIVFQVAEKMNQINKNDPNFKVNFIPWIQSHPNNLVYYNGVRDSEGNIPTVAEIAANATLAPGANQEVSPGLAEVSKRIAEIFQTPEKIRGIAENIYRAHKQFIDEGWDNWSEFAFIRQHLGADLNVTDLSIDSRGLGSGDVSFWYLLYESLYFGATEWKTIDKGLETLPRSFIPFLGDKVKYGRKVVRLDYLEKEEKVRVSWKKTGSDKDYGSADYDYLLVAAPFTQVRKWRLPQFSSVMLRAIRRLSYDSACKVALLFKTRFWEASSRPNFGGCTSTDIPLIMAFCYPSYQLNRTGPAVLLASYNYGDSATRSISMSETEHVNYALDAMAEIHGPTIYEQYAGKFARLCWLEDEHTSGAWTEPTVGQHELYLPEYFKMQLNTIFIGEHTSITHAWIASALESAVRGSVQLLLEMGLVDEAKNVTQEWMGRWMTV
ncbi:hypothetical protein L873DRAFT_1745322 [Choiromyces venosus 120613-1]|uniref:Amine oxidase domain-containing protein n=1 Tax=Choiromyces venosus 120613-1 TaxID=1336337 RepID=A0A3N4JEG8_9PEZI|nr:hypothetical protein L873DRAFT_1745322 [Choiromyces venosus 120613-1]